MLSILAFLFSVWALGELYMLLFQPEKYANMVDFLIQKVQENFVAAQLFVLALVFFFGVLLMPFIGGFLPLIATGWFWAAVFMLCYLPLCTCKEMAPFMKKLILGKEALQRLQLILGFFMFASLGVITKCILIWFF